VVRWFKRWRRSGIYLILVAVVGTWFVGGSPSFHDCVRKHKNDNYYQALHERNAVIRGSIVRLRLDVVCTGDFIDQNGNSITALATLLIAGFTGVLWRATTAMTQVAERQRAEMERTTGAAQTAADAAKKSADALPILERAYLFVEFSDSNIQEVLAMYTDNASTRRIKVRFTIFNYGKTPAIVKAIFRTLLHIDGGMGEPFYVESVLIEDEIIIASGARTEIYRVEDQRVLTDDGAVAIKERRCLVLFFGKVEYEDVFGNPHETTFWRRYEPGNNQMPQYGGKQYNKRT
jgi:hypothetical protein